MYAKEVLGRQILRAAVGLLLGIILVIGPWSVSARALILPDFLRTIPAGDQSKKNVQEKPSAKQTAEKNGSSNSVYEVKKGDTLWDIARKYGVRWQEIAALNRIGNDEYIYAGQRLKIPADNPGTYIIKKGDNLWTIAQRYRVDLYSLIAANNIKDPRRLQIGQSLTIPGREAAVMAFAATVSSRGRGSWNWPVEGPVTSPFGPRGNEFHHGLDIAGDYSCKVFPVRPGRVVFAGWLNNIYGQTVIIDHGRNIESIYAHNSKNLVTEGQYVDEFTAIARLGNTGRTTGPHVHLEIHNDGEPVDPQQYLD